ncbi:MAG: glutamate racemase [Lachnospiraceae bacterium]|nr:glutamate racemase [Lachnospiraceae bacterium]
MDKNAPIGVFDSGVGGLTVAREIMRQLPEERIVYFGDTARLPYGSKSRRTVIRFSEQIIRFLRTKDVKAIVIACNTASSFALEEVRKEVDIPIIGVINAGARAAVGATKNGKIGIIGTEGTIASGTYADTIRNMKPGVEVFGKACPLFVPLVEEGLLHDTVTDEIASRYLSVLKEKYIDTLVLGCTHYPLLRSTLARTMGADVALVNPAYETAVQLKTLLRSMEMNCDAGQNLSQGEKYQFFVSDMAEKFRAFATSILPEEVKETIQINIEEY